MDTGGTIVMPHDAPQPRSRQPAATAAEVIIYDRYTEDREAIGRQAWPTNAA